MPQSTMEVRWFGRLGEVERQELVHVLGSVGEVDERPDEYIVVPGALDFGMKLRGTKDGARLEFKGRRLDLGYHVFGESAIGRVEGWTKWSYDARVASELFGDRTRRHVGKARAQRYYAILDDGRLARSADRPAQRGGAVEVAALTLDANHYWTLAVEAFPDDSETSSKLSQFVTELLSLLEELDIESFSGALTKAASQSYPEWLSRVK